LATKKQATLTKPETPRPQSIMMQARTRIYETSYADEMLRFVVETGKSAETWAINNNILSMWNWIKKYPEFKEAYVLSKKLRVSKLEDRIEAIGDEKLDHKAHQFLLSAHSKYKQKPASMVQNNISITEQIRTASADQLLAIAKAVEDRLLALPAEIVVDDK
jgi:hypothetical protein